MRELLVSLLIQAKGNAAEGVARVGRGLDRLAGSLRTTGGAGREAARGTESFFASMVKANIVSETLLVGARRLGQAIGSLPRQVISTSLTFQALRDQLELITGSSEGAAKAFEWLSEFERQTPATLEEVTEAYVRLAGYGLDPTNGLLRSLGDTAVASRKSLRDTVEAMADATTFQFERLRELKTTAQVTGDTVTFTFMGMSRTVKKNAADIAAGLASLWDTKNAGMMARASQRLDGQVSTLTSVWQRFLATIGQSGVLQALERWLGGVNAALQRMVESGALERLGQSLGENIGRSIERLVQLLPNINTFLEGLDRNLGRVDAALSGISTLIEADIAWFARWGEIIDWVAQRIAEFSAWLDRAAGVLNRIGESIRAALAMAGRGIAMSAVPYGGAAAGLGRGSLDITLGGPGAKGATVSKMVAPAALDLSVSTGGAMGIP